MNKIISFVLLCALLLMCFSGCLIRGDSNGEKEPEQENTSDADAFEGEIDKNSDLVATLVAYLEQYLTDYEIIGRSFAQKINDVKSGIQPLHVAFDPTDYYFVCGYYNPAEDHFEFGYCCADNYTWVGYKSEADVQEYYNDMKWAVVFQINRALTVTDIISNERKVPDIQHFQIFKPTFENGVNVNDRVVFDDTFIYLNYPNCYLNRFSQNTSTMYYCKSIYYHSMNTIPCVCLDGEYYLSFHLYTVYSDGRRGEENDFSYTFGQYYDTLMNMMEKDKYSISGENHINVFATISIRDFLNVFVN
ncbi:MAG: hypothetical protein ACI3XI_07160 [Eubacteriales bacterium]